MAWQMLDSARPLSRDKIEATVIQRFDRPPPKKVAGTVALATHEPDNRVSRVHNTEDSPPRCREERSSRSKRAACGRREHSAMREHCHEQEVPTIGKATSFSGKQAPLEKRLTADLGVPKHERISKLRDSALFGPRFRSAGCCIESHVRSRGCSQYNGER